MAAHTFHGLDKRFRGHLKDRAWTVCIGAGICADVLPAWSALTREVLIQALDTNIDIEQFSTIAQTGWGFDAMMQAALNGWVARGGTPETFSAVVELALYYPLLTAAGDEGVERQVVIAFTTPHLLRKDEFHEVLVFLAKRACTAFATATALLEAVEANQGPRAVITFNYDTILETLIRMTEIDSHSRRVGRHAFPISRFARVTGPGATGANRTPIIHIHGCVTPRPTRRTRRHPHDTRDAIIGPESSYARMAASASTWAQTTFLHHAYSDSLVILGHSLSDPNLRRWLAWSAAVRADNASRLAGSPIQPLPHIWFRLKAKDDMEAWFLENAVTHLGVRVVWLDAWDQAQGALRNLLALQEH